MRTDAQLRIAEERFIDIVTTHRRFLLAYTRRLLGTESGGAEDIVQETFVRAWAKIDRLTEEFGSVQGWLCQVASNLVIDNYRMRRARPTQVEYFSSDLGAIRDHSDRVLRTVALAELLDGIWPEHRAVVVEIYLNDRTTAQVAEMLDIPVGTVKSRLHHALRVLRSRADEHIPLAS